MKKFKIGLALGGGGVRGLAHIGVLKVLKKENIGIDIVGGTSIGAIVGGGFVLDQNLTKLEEKFLGLVKRKEIVRLESFAAGSETEEKRIIFERLSAFVKELLLWNVRALKKFLVEPSQIDGIIAEVVGEKEFKETKIPFIVAATDLEKGKEVVLNDGKLCKALLASSAIAGIFAPVTLGGRTLVDGGVVSLVPVGALRESGAEFIIGVNVEKEVIQKEFHHGLDIFFQTGNICAHELNKLKLKECDFVIRPDVGTISWAQFSKAEECIKKGEEAALKVIDNVKSLIKSKKTKTCLKRFFLPG